MIWDDSKQLLARLLVTFRGVWSLESFWFCCISTLGVEFRELRGAYGLVGLGFRWFWG